MLKDAIKQCFGGFIETKFSGIRCVLINGRWVRCSDHEPFSNIAKNLRIKNA